jgi:DNA-binding Lrp family transcriptional regulator
MYAGKPEHIKLNNEALIRGALLARREITTADIVAETGLSQTTVGQIIDQMRRSGIVREAGKRASRLGRPASAWLLDQEAWTSVAIAVENGGLVWGVANALGEMRDQGSRSVSGDPIDSALGLAAELVGAEPARDGAPRLALALGVPGAVKEGKLITGEFSGDWADVDLADLFAKRIEAPVVVENDLNAIALGYAKSAESDAEERDSLAYIHFNGGACIGSGLVLGGRIIRGASSFSGELGFLPMGGGKILDDVIVEVERDDERYAEAICRVLQTVNCVVNPALIALGGRGFRFELEGAIRARFEASADELVRPCLAFVPQSLPYYLSGLSGLAAERIFPDVLIARR